MASISARVPISSGRPSVAAPMAPAAAPNTARISTTTSRYAASNTIQNGPSRLRKKLR
jgi:hypothetical protein